MAARSPFTTITSEGALLSAALLARLGSGTEQVSATSAAAYHLPPGRRVRDAINRSWTELQGAWSAFSSELDRLPAGERATTLTRERWLLPLFAELGFGRLQRTNALVVEGREYAVSHLWGRLPIHLLGADVELDQRSRGVAGAAGAAPFSMVQELLNRSEDHLWGLLSNGRRLRLLRDNTSLTRVAYVEFDLEAMFSGQVFTDFAVLWMTCHESRFEGERPADCVLERWIEEDRRQGVRALDRLRQGFESAIVTLGAGFLAAPANTALRERLRTGSLRTEDYHRQVLRLVYRLVFLLVAEDRDLLHPPETTPEARERYARFYSLGRLRDQARRHRGGRHGDLFASLRPVFAALGGAGLDAVGLPPLGSFLWSEAACPDLEGATLANRDLLEAVRHLAYTETNRTLQRVDFVDLGPEELGSVYESLLELHPRIEADAARFELVALGGSERKSTGSYYTPTALISALLDQALEPLLDEAEAAADPASALLALRVLDPACGSGHFLTAAARRIAMRLAAVETGEANPAPRAIRHALRRVVGRCVYGIDRNPMAVELAKVNLWLEAVEPGKPLTFLDHHIRCGNALLGATPELLAAGIPDAAFSELTGDDKAVVTSLRRRNATERQAQGSLFAPDRAGALQPVVADATALEDLAEDTLDGVAAKAAAWEALLGSGRYRDAVLAADLFCAAFVAPRVLGAPALTEAVYQRALSQPGRLEEAVREAVAVAASEYGFLHPHLAFPAVFPPDRPGGFDVVLGNPPWEKVKLSEKEFFAARAPEIAAAAGAKRKALIAKLVGEDPGLWDAYQSALRHAEGESHLLRRSGRYPLCGKGDVNTYAVFAEAMRHALAPTGRLGVIVPTGIATDDTTKDFFADCVARRALVSLYDFENRERIFEAVDSRVKFCLLTLTGPARPARAAEFAFFAHRPEDLADPERRFSLTPEDLELINPNTRTAPIFRSRRDAELTKKIYRRVPVLLREGDPAGNPWGIGYQRMFDMANDSELFRTADELRGLGAAPSGNVWVRGDERWLPLYEAKMVHHFTHRWGDYAMKRPDDAGSNLPDVPVERLDDPGYQVQPRYWVEEAAVRTALRDPAATWLLGFRNVTNTTNERTMIAAAIPAVAVGNSEPLLHFSSRSPLNCLMPSVLSSFALDFLVRNKMGGTNLNFFLVKQLPVLPQAVFEERAAWSPAESVTSWMAPRVLELTYTAWDLAGFAAELGYTGAPFHWDPDRRRLLRAELDAAFFHLYGYDRADVDYVMDTFPIVARKDEQAYGEYRTKRLVLERYDALGHTARSGAAYRSVLDPPPADPAVAHGRR